MIRHRTAPDRAAGFTVLEMAISLAIAGIALTVLLQLLTTALIVSGRADQVAEATMLARSRLAETTAVEPIKLGTTTGTGPSGLVWRTTVSSSSNAISVTTVGRRLVDVSVSVLALRRGSVTEVLELRSLAFAAVE
jgi:Tfp pilus assembly protein PilE